MKETAPFRAINALKCMDLVPAPFQGVNIGKTHVSFDCVHMPRIMIFGALNAEKDTNKRV